MRVYLLLLVAAAWLALLQGGQAAEALRGSEGGSGAGGRGRRSLVTAPKDVYSVRLNNQLKGAVNATITYSKGTTNELLVEKKQVPAGGSYKSGPYDYQEGSASFHYVVQAIRVRRVVPAGETPQGVGAVPNAPQESLQLTAPFDGVAGVTPLVDVDIAPLEEDAGKTHLGSLTTRLPAA